jgi:cyclopropane fatty-acyl-phospholipid synthase-like methyltransferase
MINTNRLESETLMIDKIFQDPIINNIHATVNHFSRYLMALDRIQIDKNDVIVDASCGMGYGTYILSMKANHAIGLDCNFSYLSKAIDLFNTHNIKFFSYEEFFEQMINSPNLLDKIVCIETLEHIPKEEMNSYINNLLSILKEGGSMYLTTPIGNDGPSDYNPYHLNEPTFNTIFTLFENRFNKLTIECDHLKNSFGYTTKYLAVSLFGYRKGEL